jgi:hypothetical protein
VYPDSSGSTQIWTHVQNLATSVQTALTAAAGQTWTTWALSWDTASGGGFTSVGAGFSEGYYTQIGNLVHAEFRVQLGAGFAVDTGTFILNLPVAARLWSGTVAYGTVGNWSARNNSDPYHYAGALGIWDSSGSKVHFAGSWDGTAPRSRIDSNDPIVWASSDVLSGVLNYRAA